MKLQILVLYFLNIYTGKLTMKIAIKIAYSLLIFLLPSVGICFATDVGKTSDLLEIFDSKMKGDSTMVALTLDSANSAYIAHDYTKAIDFAEKTFELSKKFTNSNFTVQSVLIIARSYRDIHLMGNSPSAFNNTLKYYVKAITALGSVDSKLELSKIYKEYGDFYANLELVDLTIQNYDKALNLVLSSSEYSFQKELAEKIANLNYDLGNLEAAISYFNILHSIHEKLNEDELEIDVLKTMAQLYRENKDFDNAIYASKEILSYYERIGDISSQITYLSNIGEISYEAGNRDQADKAFKNYFSLVKHDHKFLEEEIASLRYIRNLITEGDIYSWSMDNGYWSDYKTAIRYYNDAQKIADFQSYPDLASTLLNRIGTIYFKNKDYKTCITYFDLALFYGRKTGNLDFLSTNHIMLARVYDAVEKWKEATSHYELHAAYKDSIIQIAENERKALEEISVDNEKENFKVEQILDLIEAQERQELAVAERELINIALKRDLELFRQDLDLKDLLIQNQELDKESARRKYLLTMEKLENASNEEKIELLNSERNAQKLKLQNIEIENQNKKQQIKILEQQNSLASSQQAYYRLSIILISLILVFIIVVYIQKRKANVKLRGQNEKIEQQSEKLKQAYENLELLGTIGRDITSSLIIEEIIETVYENLNTLMDASVLGIGVYNQTKNQLHFPGVRERNQRLKDINIDLSEEKTLAAFCFNNQKEVVLDNFYKSYANYIQPDIIPIQGDGNATSIVYFPLTIGDKRLGVLTVQSFDDNAFTNYSVNIIRNIAIYTKIALENANVYRELEMKSLSLKRANKNIGQQNKLIEEQYQQLVSINEEKNNLINILAHDLRNPLATAMSMTELVLFEKENLSVDQHQASEIIWRGLTRMNDMIRKILDIKAIESQKIVLDFESLNIAEVVDSLQNNFEAAAKQKDIRMHFSIESDEPVIKVDRNYLIQILENLISNALKFSPYKRNIFIRVHENGHFVRISVRDEGPGIPENEINNLFKKYSKLSPRPTAGEQSIGLGLSIAKKYVEVMEGNIWCESKVGRGSEFIVEFNKEFLSVV